MLPSVFISGDISGGSGFKKTSVLESCGSSEVIGTLSIKVRTTLSSDNVTIISSKKSKIECSAKIKEISNTELF